MTTKRWERRRSRWPIVAGLLSLFLLALAAPYCWKRPVLNVHALMEQRLQMQLTQSSGMPLPAADLLPVADFLVFELETPASKRPLPMPPPSPLDGLNNFCGAFNGLFAEWPEEQASSARKPAGNPSVSPELIEEILGPQPQLDPPAFPTVRISNLSDRLAMVIKRISTISSFASPTIGPAEDPTPTKPEPQNFPSVIEQAEPHVALRVTPIKEAEEQKPPEEAQETEESQSTPMPETAEEADPAEEPAAEQATLDEQFRTPLIRQRPAELIHILKALTQIPAVRRWASATLEDVQLVTTKSFLSPKEISGVLDELDELAQLGAQKALTITEPGVQQNWLQAAEGLQRRLGIWRAILCDSQQEDHLARRFPTTASMAVSLRDVSNLLGDSAEGDAWRDYLLLADLILATSEGAGISSNDRIQLAQEVLARLHEEHLTAEQQAFLAEGPLPDFAEQLRQWAAGPVDFQLLLALVERYEQNGRLRYARAISQLCQRMQWSDDADLRQLASTLQEQYRGANMRIAISHAMLNRMVPDQQIENAVVRETIAGHKVKGRSRTSTKVHVALVPAEHAWKIGLEADGKVYSQTRSDTWPVKVRNAARFEYEAEKIVTIDNEGLHIGRATSRARGRNEFLGTDSKFDRVPIFGALFSGIAKKQNERSRPQAVRQVKSKVAHQARWRMDTQADPKLTKLERKFRDRILAPFGQLALSAEPLDMYTTSDRAVMKLRLANFDQLAAHSPRPSAPADSLVSMQLHETAINNALAGLELEGKRLSLMEIHEMLAAKFGRTQVELPEDLTRRAIVEFAPYDAIHVSFREDRLELVLSIRELAHGRDKIRDFQAHAFYRPIVVGLAVQLVRDDTLQFSGRDLRTGPRIVLHSVLGKLFSNHESIPLVRPGIQQDQRLAGLMVTQLVIDHGWMALAVGPASQERTAWRAPIYHLENTSR